MKKYFFLFFLIAASLAASAQKISLKVNRLYGVDSIQLGGTWYKTMGGGGGGTGTGTVDSVTVSNDSLFYWNSGTRVFITKLSTAIAGGDTTIFATVLDSTGQINNRVLFARNNKISSSPRMLFDSARSKLVINNANSSAGGNNIKLFVDGQATFTSYVTIGQMSTQTDTALFKPMVSSPGGGVVRIMDRWPVGGASVTKVYEELTATAAQTAFTFTYVPTTSAGYMVYINSMPIPKTYYSISGNTITFTSGLVLNDSVIIQGIQ